MPDSHATTDRTAPGAVPGENGQLTSVAWITEAEARYGRDTRKWRFRCPICKVETSVQEWRDAKAPEGAVAFSCIGRFLPGEPSKAFGGGKTKQPCDYTGGGLLKLNPIAVRDEDGRVHRVFDFADDPLSARATEQGAGDAGRDGEEG